MSVQASDAGLRRRLRSETATLHDEVEALIDVPGSIRSRGSYVAMLGRFFAVHQSLEDLLAVRGFEQRWRRVGLDLDAHRRAHLLAADLSDLGHQGVTAAVALPPLRTFGQALGCLYVLEGSALGGPTVASLVRAAIGEVPMRFLTGENRPGLVLWRAMCDALGHFDARSREGDEVVTGACQTFALFADQLTPPAARL
jgi:heme oxygenase (biliverdin-IX-beta and delta-forming)